MHIGTGITGMDVVDLLVERELGDSPDLLFSVLHGYKLQCLHGWNVSILMTGASLLTVDLVNRLYKNNF